MLDREDRKNKIWLGVMRLGGALMMVSPASGYMALVGETKEPVDFEALGLYPPPLNRMASLEPVFQLKPKGPVTLQRPQLALAVPENQTEEWLAEYVAKTLLIRRNGSVSERLWNLAIESSPPLIQTLGQNSPPWLEQLDGVRDLTWLTIVPLSVWEIVRESVLRCS